MLIQQLPEAARVAVGRAATQFRLASEQQTPLPAGYSITTTAYNGCLPNHNLAALQALKKRGVTISYINVNPAGTPVDPPMPADPFEQIATASPNEAFAKTDALRLGMDNTIMALVGPDGKAIRLVNSKANDFIAQVETMIRTHHAATIAPQSPQTGR